MPNLIKAIKDRYMIQTGAKYAVVSVYFENGTPYASVRQVYVEYLKTGDHIIEMLDKTAITCSGSTELSALQRLYELLDAKIDNSC
jgi:hypothetical protein